MSAPVEKQSVIERLSAPLGAEDVEFKIGTVSGGKGFSLLAYKTARADTKRLNDVFGLGWTNRYFYDDKQLLSCEISVLDKESGQWVSRTDIGMPSMSEGEKGSYSDAFKRAGFKWGIGIELYRFPFIWVNWDQWEEYKGKQRPKFFNVDDVSIDEYEVENGRPVKLKISIKGNIVYEMGKRQPAKPKNNGQPVDLIGVLKSHNIDKDAFKVFANIKTKAEADRLFADKGALSDMIERFKEQ